MPPITKNLLICNVLAFLALIVAEQVYGIDLNDVLGLHFFLATDFHVYQLFTYMFMHAGWEHIILNMFMLWMFGAVIENTFGAKRFLFYYIFCGIGAGLMQEMAQFAWIFSKIAPDYGFANAFQVMAGLGQELNGLTTVGASGAIYALLLAFGMLFPEEKMFIIPIPIPIKAKWMVMGSIAIELFSALGAPGDQVAHIAHLGGMVFGFFLIRHWRRSAGGYGSSFDAGRFFNSMRNKWKVERNKPSQNVRNADWDYNARQKANQEEIDAILDKIRKSGYDSLSKEEKQKLFDQSSK